MSIEQMVTYYRNYASIFRKEGTSINKGEAYSMHIGYRDDNNFLGQNGSASELMEKKLIKDADIQDGQQILDAGCGTGTLGFEISSLYPNTKVYGIDLLDDHLKVAYRQQGNFPAVFFTKQDYLNLAFRDSSFDRIFFCESLIHAQDKDKLLLEASRVLKPRGKIIIADIFMLNDDLSEEDQLGKLPCCR
ncbi:MAG: class I SAM-dependent methyltransferase [Actinobacteria bacterium]|nr:class I SAM-dependent methyltransferase [Actinomycetota bacterium]